jgi:hypothetical protein
LFAFDGFEYFVRTLTFVLFDISISLYVSLQSPFSLHVSFLIGKSVRFVDFSNLRSSTIPKWRSYERPADNNIASGRAERASTASIAKHLAPLAQPVSSAQHLAPLAQPVSSAQHLAPSAITSAHAYNMRQRTNK